MSAFQGLGLGEGLGIGLGRVSGFSVRVWVPVADRSRQSRRSLDETYDISLQNPLLTTTFRVCFLVID